MVKVGNPGDVGVAQFSDMLFTVAEVLPGATLVEVNMAGTNPGDVGFWNSHFRIGGAAGSTVQTSCGGAPANCKAAFMLMHLTSSSSAYVENAWRRGPRTTIWTPAMGRPSRPAAACLLKPPRNLAPGYGELVSRFLAHLSLCICARIEANIALPTFTEHNTLYQVNFHNAQNVFFGFQQSETAYWQGNGSPSIAPDPWSPLALASDPDYSWCSGGDAQCRMALYLRIHGSSNLNFYGGSLWTFFNNNNGCGSNCQTLAALIESTSKRLFYFGLNTRLVNNPIRNNGANLVT